MWSDSGKNSGALFVSGSVYCVLRFLIKPSVARSLSLPPSTTCMIMDGFNYGLECDMLVPHYRMIAIWHPETHL